MDDIIYEVQGSVFPLALTNLKVKEDCFEYKNVSPSPYGGLKGCVKYDTIKKITVQNFSKHSSVIAELTDNNTVVLLLNHNDSNYKQAVDYISKKVNAHKNKADQKALQESFSIENTDSLEKKVYLSPNGYCISCGTEIKAYSSEVMDVIKRTLEGEKVIFITEEDNCPPDYRRKIWCGHNAAFLSDVHTSNILLHKMNYDENRETRHVTITDCFAVNPEFKRIWNVPGHMEFVVSDYNGRKSARIVNCPVCGSHVTIDDSIVSWVKNEALAKEKKKCKEDVVNYIADREANCIAPIPSVGKKGEDVEKYLESLINIEAEIRYFTNRLEDILLSSKTAGRSALKERCTALAYAKKPIEQEIDIAKKELTALDKRYQLLSLDFTPEYFGLCAPIAPEMKKPGMFNKKKIEEENRQAMEHYENELSAYNLKWEQMKTEEVNRRMAENDRITEEREKAKEQFETKILKLSEQLDDVNIDLTDSGLQKAETFCLAELEETKEKINQLCDVRAQLIRLAIVHPKYLDFVALTTIAEYFETGRCTALTGPDGAYNLYESEIRANRVIAQLDKVIANLEAIRQNQYRTYSILSQIKNDTVSISNKMESAVKSLSDISANTAAIKETNEQISYYTAKTAYYSKLNAELTDALGYLIAFK